MKTIHGIFNVYKPTGMSSHDVVNQIRKQFSTRRVGHAGTLDVEASGVLAIGINEGTKLLHYLQTHTKRYHFGIAFGRQTDTLDHAGETVKTEGVSLPDWLDCDAFLGPYEQMPPAYSAVKVNGKKLYEYARQGLPIPAVTARFITVKSFQQLTPLIRTQEGSKARFEVEASSGLYVRQLALDLAIHHGTVAHTYFIERLSVGPFTIDQAQPLDALNRDHCIRLADAMPDFKSVLAGQIDPKALAHGKPLSIDYQGDTIKVVNAHHDLFGLYEWAEGTYRPLRMFKGD